MTINYSANIIAVGLIACLMTLFLSGCQAPPIRVITEQDLISHYPDFVRSYELDLEKISTQSLARIQSEYRNARTHTGNKRQSYDVLVLSGGGSFGAFGAGFLAGWGEVTDKEFIRPWFDTVSGISTGALIAPFAFLGTPDAYRKIAEIYENPQQDWVRKRGIIPYLPGNVSLFDVSKLHSKIRSIITPNLIQAIAIETSKNRQLLVGATNVDYGLMRVWDLAKIAHENPVDEAVKRTTSILLASAAIPGVFPPIPIDDFLYVDGGASMQVVSGIDERGWLYSRDTLSLGFVDNNAPIRIRIWMIVNQKLLPDHKIVRSRWTEIAERSLSVILRASTLQTIQDTETYIRLINQLPEFDAEMRYVAIPQDYQIDDSDEMFDAEIMRKLANLGQKMGADPASWRTKALRPGAPF